MDVNIKDFEGAIAELETIVRQLEEGDLALEQSLELYERGVRLSRYCHARLEEAERRIEVLGEGGELRPAPPALAAVGEEMSADLQTMVGVSKAERALSSPMFAVATTRARGRANDGGELAVRSPLRCGGPDRRNYREDPRRDGLPAVDRCDRRACGTDRPPLQEPPHRRTGAHASRPRLDRGAGPRKASRRPKIRLRKKAEPT